MKTKILMLALLGFIYGTKMYGQCTTCASLCTPNAFIYFPYLSNTCYVEVTNTCVTPNTWCQYFEVAGTGECLCLDGVTNVSYGSGCAPTTTALGGKDANGNPCLQIVVKNHNSTIWDTYSAYWGGSDWQITWQSALNDHHYTTGGIQIPDISLQPCGGGWEIQILPGAPTLDDESDIIAF